MDDLFSWKKGVCIPSLNEPCASFSLAERQARNWSCFGFVPVDCLFRRLVIWISYGLRSRTILNIQQMGLIEQENYRRDREGRGLKSLDEETNHGVLFERGNSGDGLVIVIGCLLMLEMEIRGMVEEAAAE